MSKLDELVLAADEPEILAAQFRAYIEARFGSLMYQAAQNVKLIRNTGFDSTDTKLALARAKEE